MKKLREQQANTDYLRLLECARNLAQWNVRGNERECEFSAGQTHCEIFDAASLGKKFRLSGEPEANVVHASFVNRPGYNCIELAAPRESNRFFERSRSGTRSFRGGMSWRAIRIFADDLVVGCLRNATGLQSKIDNLSSDPGAIAQRDANAWLRRAHARARTFSNRLRVLLPAFAKATACLAGWGRRQADTERPLR